MKFVSKFLAGGPMPADGGAGAPQGGDPMQEILTAAQQAVESQDCSIAMQVCQILVQAAGGGAPAEAAPEEAAPAPAEGAPVMKMGGKTLYVSRRIKGNRK